VGRRIQGLAVVLGSLFILILVQLVNIQVVRAPQLNSSNYNPRAVSNATLNPRGQILSSTGEILASSTKLPTGVYQRNYPFGALTSQIVGIDSPVYGRYGLEGYYNKNLTAHSLDPSSWGQLLVPVRGTDTITTTLSTQLQSLANKELAGRDGAVVVVDSNTGAVLAMFSNPTYNPNPLVSQDRAVEEAAWKAATCRTCNPHHFSALASLAYQYTFAPGSTSKVVTSAAAYELDPPLVNKYYPYTTALTIPQTTQQLHNFGFGGCGGTLAIMLPPSCDTGFANMGLDLGAHNLSAEAEAFGYNKKSPLDLPGVATSSFPTEAELTNNAPSQAYSAIGQQNVGATALQNALIAAGIANEGVVMGPHLVSQIRDQNGNSVYHWKPKPWTKAMTKDNAASLSLVMQNVSSYGTAAGVFPPYLNIASKTGTAQVGYPVVTNTHDWMIAFGPNPKPTIAIAVVLPFQDISNTGAGVAGPVIRCMMLGALAYQAHQPVMNTASTCAA
jgi:peptidoglycan glycosyltransferase